VKLVDMASFLGAVLRSGGKAAGEDAAEDEDEAAGYGEGEAERGDGTGRGGEGSGSSCSDSFRAFLRSSLGFPEAEEGEEDEDDDECEALR
jgi:hypothetical protein